ncbi:hypothetical protein V6N13_072486 [Hibiscus sabdariffa]|uniref:Uncharacterized protein n=1 Tax=Hibiscus sabdariffa TaxID=183260 RepID=A0ABR2R808_9ROSI
MCTEKDIINGASEEMENSRIQMNEWELIGMVPKGTTTTSCSRPIIQVEGASNRERMGRPWGLSKEIVELNFLASVCKQFQLRFFARLE